MIHRPILILSRLFIGVIVLGMIVSSLTVAAPPKPGRTGPRHLIKLEEEFIADLEGDDAVLKVGDKATITIQSGKKYEDVEITELQPGKESNTLKLIGSVSGKGVKQKLQVSTIVRLETADREFDVVQNSASKAHLLLDLKKRDEQARERLAPSRRQLWDEPTAEQQAKAVEDLKEMCRKVGEAFSDRKFVAQETEFFLFYTDMPANQVAGYIANLDTMYRQLCLAFGLPPDKNIWLGKGMIFVFADRNSFVRFEKEFMNYDVPIDRVQGLNHSNTNGRNITAFYRGNDPAYFATVLVHETAHGFLHRFRSNVHIHSWMNEGVAEWIANVCVPASNAIQRKQSNALVAMRRTGTMGGDLFREGANIDPEQYGVVSLLTEFMLQKDPNLYRAFLVAIKEGYSPEEALKATYGGTIADLVQSFGKSIGVPNLVP